MKNGYKYIFVLYFIILSCGVVEKLTNRAPIITSISATPDSLLIGETSVLAVEATDPDNDELSYQWNCNHGLLSSSQGSTVQWTAPQYEGSFVVEATVKDVNGEKVSDNITLIVTSENAPSIKILSPKNGEEIVALNSIPITVQVSPIQFINRVEFFIDDVLVATDKQSPFQYDWVLSGLSGLKELKCAAYRSGQVSVPGVDSIFVHLYGVVTLPK